MGFSGRPKKGEENIVTKSINLRKRKDWNKTEKHKAKRRKNDYVTKSKILRNKSKISRKMENCIIIKKNF